MSSFVLCVRNKEGDGFGGRIGAQSYLEVPDADAVPAQKHKVSSYTRWLASVMAEATPGGDASNNRDIVFLVHGYNTDPEEALKRQRLVEQKLNARGFRCLLIGFDWPTAGSAAAYAYDRVEAQNTASVLVSAGIIPFTKSTRPDCPINVHVMAHSMGGFVVREAFRTVDRARDTGISPNWRVAQLVLFAADISSSCFEIDHPDMLPVFDHCGRLTNYFSGYDQALAVSNLKNVDISARVGRVGMPVETPAHDKAVDVDCGPRYEKADIKQFKVIDGMISHSWYLEDEVWYDDLAYTLKGQLDRNAIPTRKNVGLNDFVLNP